VKYEDYAYRDFIYKIDNFLANPLNERQRALKSTYRTIDHNGVKYRGISLLNEQSNVKRIEHHLGLKFHNPTVMYRRYLANEKNETFIHSDVLIGTFTGILFLNLPEHCKGGTAFWRHRVHGFSHHEDSNGLAKRGLKDTKELWGSVYQDGFDESKWEMTEMIPMKFNRLILFWSPRYHSRYPMQAFGDSIETGRLVKVFFLPVTQ